jgi:hypothetical protein
MIMFFGPYAMQTVEQICDTDEGLIYLDLVVDEISDPELKEEVKTFLKKNDARLDAALESRSHELRLPDPIPRKWWE